MTSRRATTAVTFAASLLLICAALAACAGDDAGAASAPATSGSVTPSAAPSTTPTPTPTANAAVPIPSDCRAILSDAVLAQLADVPLNDPALGVATGVQADGSLVCIWRDPRADTTGLITTISGMNRGPALDMLNSLATQEGFSCYMPDAGTRCEKTFPNPTYPVTDGRTLYWRDGILIDTRYSNLAPTGYTSSIVASIFA